MTLLSSMRTKEQLLEDEKALLAEIERLQQQDAKLREELSVWLKCYQEEKRKREELVQRVHEALGDRDA